MNYKPLQVDRGSEEPDSESGSGAERRPSDTGGKAGSESPKGAARGRGDSGSQEEHEGPSKATNGMNGVGG
jgi:hypothetical protein